MKHTHAIQNIRCGGCANTIKKELSKIFDSVEIDIESKIVTVEAKNEQDIQNGAEALKKLGYPLLGEESGFVDKAKSFVSCAIGKFD
jgi:copper chaperone CopZ